jgi:TonB family protein
MSPHFSSNLFAYSLQAAALIAAAGAAAAALRVREPRVLLRYWQAVLLAALLLPALQPWRRAASVGAAVSVVGPEGAAATPAPQAHRLGAVAGRLVLAGVGLRLLAVAAGLWRLRHYRRRARPLQLDWAGSMARQLGVRASLLRSRDLDVPVNFGALRPAILLPARFAELPVDQQRAIVCHELLHIRRRDWLATLAEEAVRAALWFHPAILWLLRRLRLSREQLVDREALAITRCRAAYLEALLEVARQRVRARPLAASAFFTESHLKCRIELLLEEVAMSKTRVMTAVAFSSLVLLLVGVAAARAFPLQAVEDQAPADRERDVPTGVAGGVAGGVEGGIGGGLPGGIEGGLAGGVVGGVDGDEPSGKKKTAAGRKLIHKVDPKFPLEGGKKVKRSGDVVLELTIEKSGEVSDVKVLKGRRSFSGSAVEAVRQWRFEPSVQSPALATVTIRFAPDPPPRAPAPRDVPDDAPPPPPPAPAKRR